MKKAFCATSLPLLLLSFFTVATAQTAREATIESETKARLVLQTQLSSKLNEVGDPVRAILEEAIYVNGDLVMQEGTVFRGRITHVKSAGRPHKSGEMAIVFERVGMPWGEEAVSVVLTSAADWSTDEKRKADEEGKMSGGKQGGKTVDNVIRGSSVGAMGAGVIILSGGSGAAGAATLGGGALTGLMLTKGAEVRMGPGTIFRVKFAKPMTLPVVRSSKSQSDEFDRTRKSPDKF